MPPKASSDLEANAAALALRFGKLVRQRREQLQMRQDDLALVSGLGRRFIIDLESGKPTAQLGKALVAASAVGLRPFDLMEENDRNDAQLLPDLPEFDSDQLPSLSDDEVQTLFPPDYSSADLVGEDDDG
ncbi:helix-turn-helix domain-containing protein [Terricaulis sp.]|uniref:helix-turn-helix domain-containing protein n=1 Tax=Terricaulis sp. TaxID=2768686 RepID=UPI002AC74CA4|nr:helix-turn-helix domain-containing protein [Terricaulis sp.]MDZ4691153.1 hypothetical protein [Terricaulis sp.]